jgi:hypothetical protein
VTEIVHHLLSLTGQNDLLRRLEPRAPSRVDRALQLRDLGGDERLRLVDPLLLTRVVGRQLAELLHHSPDVADRLLVRLEERLVARDHEAALPGLRVLHRAENRREVLENEVRVLLGVRRRGERGNAPVRHAADPEQQRERQREAQRDLPTERPHVFAP